MREDKSMLEAHMCTLDMHVSSSMFVQFFVYGA